MSTCDILKLSTCRSFFNKLLAKPRDGLIEQVEEFILDTNNSSAKSSDSSKTWFRGRTSRQSNIAFRRNFIILVPDEALVWLKRVSNRKWLESCLLFTSWKTTLRSSTMVSGTVSKLRILSLQLDLLVFTLNKDKSTNYKKKMFNRNKQFQIKLNK